MKWSSAIGCFLAWIALGLSSGAWAQQAALAGSASLRIASMTVQGENLVFTANLSPGMTDVLLEASAELGAAWEQVGALVLQPNGIEALVAIPKPPGPMAFFRLRARPVPNQAPLVSDSLQYVAMPSLGANLTSSGQALLHFRGRVDGSDRIIIRREGAMWHHVNWEWPSASVEVNGVAWNPQERNFLTTLDPVAFLPESFSLDDVKLAVISGRDVVSLERGEKELILNINDTPSGADEYELELCFNPTSNESRPVSSSTAAVLRIVATIDGSDCLKLTSTQAVWEHRAWSPPSTVSLNGLAWNARETEVLGNQGPYRYLPEGVDLSTARLVRRSGRDLATFWAEEDQVVIWFADNPLGRDAYELEIAFGDSP